MSIEDILGCDSLKIGFIGAGKVGTAFGRYLAFHKCFVCGYYSRSYISAKKAAEATGSVAYFKIEDIVKNSDIIFITTPDDEIESVCEKIAQKELFISGQYVGHMSGALSSIALESAKKLGCYTFSLHPLQAFSDIEKGFLDLKHTYFSIEGQRESLDIIGELIERLQNSYFEIDSEQKVLYHAAACILSNYIVTLMDEGLSYLNAIGVSQEEGLKAIMPLVLGSLNNTLAFGTKMALTGPIARGDVGTIKTHLEKIQELLPQKEVLYKELGIRTVELAKCGKLMDKDKADLILKLLREV